MKQRRGIEARAVCRDAAGRILIVADEHGRGVLPGGVVAQGDDPGHALLRWAARQGAGSLVLGRPLRVVTDVQPARRWRRGRVHRDTILYSARVSSSPERGGWRWIAEAELASLPAVPLPDLPRWDPWRRQRFAAYGHVTDPGRNILLTRIAQGYPGSGLWHLPGGGTDFGESTEAALHREITEETGQQGEIMELVRVSHHHRLRTDDGRAADWHAVRVTYAVRVHQPALPRVLERGGSTAAAAWFTPAEVFELPLTDVAREALLAPPAPVA